jgi:uncharacterized membrane protein
MRRFGHGVFEVAVILKGINGAFELIGGISLLAVDTDVILRWVSLLSQEELSSDPHDPLARLVTAWAAGFGHHEKVVGAAYLLFHGVAKLTLATLLLLGYRSAYPIAVTFFTAFIAYAAFRLMHHWSWPLAILVGIDLITVAIVAREWWATASTGKVGGNSQAA